jgi:AAA15 family ATPase/GTPase
MIFIKKLTIQNYKCFENEPIDFHVPDGTNEGSGLNILIGENGNGKTAILESINYLTLSSFSTENKLSINDFYDYQKEIVIQADTKEFDCKSTIDYYKDWTFQSKGLEFSAKSRNSKARGKLLSPPFEIHNYFQLAGKYIKKDGSEVKDKDIDSRDKIFNNGNINNDEINVFYFDKNRTRQITTGNYKTTFERICDDLNWKFAKGIDDEN